MYFDEEFYQIGEYTNHLSGERNPNSGCDGELSGMIDNMVSMKEAVTRNDYCCDITIHQELTN